MRAAFVANRFLRALPPVDCGQSALNKRWSRDPYTASPSAGAPAGAPRARGGPSVGERRWRGGGSEHWYFLNMPGLFNFYLSFRALKNNSCFIEM